MSAVDAMGATAAALLAAGFMMFLGACLISGTASTPSEEKAGKRVALGGAFLAGAGFVALITSFWMAVGA